MSGSKHLHRKKKGDVFMSNVILKNEYASEAECKNAVNEFNKDKAPDEEIRYCSYFNELTNKRMYVPCSISYFYAWRNMLAEEHRKRDLESRCLIPSERYSYQKRCTEDCSRCPYGKSHREGEPFSLDKAIEENSNGITVATTKSPYDVVLELEQHETLAREMNQLDETSKKVLELFNEGYTDAQIGAALNMKRSTVQYRKAILIKRLKEKLVTY